MSKIGPYASSEIRPLQRKSADPCLVCKAMLQRTMGDSKGCLNCLKLKGLVRFKLNKGIQL